MKLSFGFFERLPGRLLGAMLGMALLFPYSTARAAEVSAQDLERATQNPLLWKHFSAVAQDLRSGYNGYGRKERAAVPADLDAQTEALIEGFLKRVNRQSWELASAGEQLTELEGTGNASSRKERSEKLKTLQKAARNLRATLSPVYFYEMGKGARHSAEGQEKSELKDLAQLVFATYRTIQGYVFQEQHTVSIARLQDENMLVCLGRIQNMARRLQRQSPSD